jgi:hypothetical protein
MFIAARIGRSIFPVLAVALAVAVPQRPVPAAQTGHVILAPYRAVYRLQLARTRGIRNIDAVGGRILIDLSGSACEGYAQQFQQIIELQSVEGQNHFNDVRSATWEDGKARNFSFHTVTSHDGNRTDTVDGHAERGAKSVTVSLSKPRRQTFGEPADVVFPIEQIRRIVEAARAGRRFITLAVYDGSQTGRKLYKTLTVIGRAISPGRRPPDDAAAKVPAMRQLTRWPVTVSYYDGNAHQGQGGELTPVYITGFELYENGIARALWFKDSNMIVSGKLTSLAMEKTAPCH